MISIDTPGFPIDPIQIHHLVLDYNGTIAIDGQLIPGVKQKLNHLSKKLNIHIITADTFGTAGTNLSGIHCQVHILEKDHQDEAKLRYLEALDPDHCAAIGNGRNDRKMLAAAALGIAVIQNEGAAYSSLANADIVCNHIHDALLLFSNPRRITATLRN